MVVESPLGQILDSQPEPVAYLRSLDYKIEDIEGQCVKDWFKNEFGAKNTLQLHAKVKGAVGRAKAKVTLDPSDKKKIGVQEDIEIQTDIDYGVQGLFKIREKELSAQFDFGLKPIAANWFNPYVVFRLPRVGGICKPEGSIGVGGVFHFDTYFRRRGRHQIELDVGFGSLNKNEVALRQNLSVWYRNFVFGWYEAWKLTSGFARESKASASYGEGPVRAYGQIELDQHFHLTNAGFGASYKISPELKAFVQTNQPLKKEGHPMGVSSLELGAGVDVNHPISGVGVKLGYFHRQRIASVLSFKLNKYFSGSLLFDVS
jgi:hypothetical protein